MVVKTQSTGNANYRRSYEASPFFEFSNAEISASKYWIIDLAENDTRSVKYLPLSNVRIINNSTENITLFTNQAREGMTIPAGTIISLDKASIGSYQSLKILNLSSTNAIALNLIKVSCWREGVVIDEAFKRMHKAFYKFLFRG